GLAVWQEWSRECGLVPPDRSASVAGRAWPDAVERYRGPGSAPMAAASGPARCATAAPTQPSDSQTGTRGRSYRRGLLRFRYVRPLTILVPDGSEILRHKTVMRSALTGLR